jgi:spore coat protein A
MFVLFLVCVAVAFPSCSNASIGERERCVWTLDRFVEELVIPPVVQNVSRLTLDARVVRTHQFHPQMPRMTVYGFNGLMPGPTIVVPPRQTLQVDLVNSLPVKHELAVDLRAHHVYGEEPLLTFHLHGAKVRSRYDGQPK